MAAARGQTKLPPSSGCSAFFQKPRSCRWNHQAAPQQLAHRPPRRSRVPEQRQSASGGRLALDHLTSENVVRSIEPLDDLLVIPGSALRSGSPTCRCGLGNRIACSRMTPDLPRIANLESASRGVLLRCPLWFSGSRGEARCDRVTENARDDQRPDRIRAVQEFAVLDRRRDGADDLSDDIFGRAEGQWTTRPRCSTGRANWWRRG